MSEITAMTQVPSEGGCATMDIADVTKSFLLKLGYTHSIVSLDKEFETKCRNEISRRKCASLIPYYLPAGMLMSVTAYAHLPNVQTRVFIALYTALAIYMDDLIETDVDAVRAFNDRFVNKEPHADPIVQEWDSLLREAPSHWSPMVSNMIVTSSLNMITALLLEHETKGVTIDRSAVLFPTFVRLLSGDAMAYALFIFPAEVPAGNFVQAMPHLMDFLSTGNDVLSFYKEEMAGESVNRISLIASLTGTSKLEHLEKLVEEVVDSHQHTLSILSPFEELLTVYDHFSRGYVAWHFASKRYRLNELYL